MRKKMTTTQAMQLVNISCKLDVIPALKLREMLARMISDNENDKGTQLNHMNARIYNCRTLKSYNTLVAYYDGINVIELGKYSTSTARQVTAFANMCGADVIRLTDSYDYIPKLNDYSYKFMW